MIKRALNFILNRLKHKQEEPSRQMMPKVEAQKRVSGPPPDELLAQATCAVISDGEAIATAWLVTSEGHLITAGHVLGTDDPLAEVEVQFTDDISQKAYKVQWGFQEELAIDFAVLKLAHMPKSRRPLPISLARSFSGTFKLHGYGKSLSGQTAGEGQFVGPHGSKSNRLFRLRSKELAEEGFSGGAVYSQQLGAVVAIQIEAGKARIGPTSETVLAMPLYRVAELSSDISSLQEKSHQKKRLKRVIVGSIMIALLAVISLFAWRFELSNETYPTQSEIKSVVAIETIPIMPSNNNGKPNYFDDFEASINWRIWDDNDGQALYESNAYRIISKDTKSGWTSVNRDKLFTNFDLEVDVTPLTYDLITGYSVVVGWQEGENYHQFITTPNGECGFRKLENYRPIGTPVMLPCPKPVQNKKVRVRLEVKGKNMKAFIDNQFVAEATFSDYGGGNIGLGVYNGGEVGSGAIPQAQFDNLAIWEIPSRSKE